MKLEEILPFDLHLQIASRKKYEKCISRQREKASHAKKLAASVHV